MKVNLKKLRTNLHAGQNFYLEGPGNPELLEDMGGSFTEPVSVFITIENTGRVYAGSGNINTAVQLVCSRCLSPINFPIDTRFCVTMIEGAQQSEFSDEEEILVIAANGDVDLSRSIDEAIFLCFPMNPLCDVNCQGICPVCGINKNKEKCHCQEDNIDPRWDKLKNLK